MKRKSETREDYNQRVREYHRLWSRDHPRKRPLRKQREHNWRKYGITDFTRDDYDIKFAFQNGCCAICGKHQSEMTQSLSVDHNHKTGAVRGLLCKRCNSRIAVLEDEAFLEKARKYLIE